MKTITKQQISPNELRIGNRVYAGMVKGLVLAVDETTARIKYYRSDNGQPHVSRVDYEFIEGIPLTEKWLLQFGFIYKRQGAGGQDEWAGYGYWILPFGNFNLIGTKYGTVYFQRERDWNIKHVHQLQNLYFDLIGIELEIKPNQPIGV